MGLVGRAMEVNTLGIFGKGDKKSFPCDCGASFATEKEMKEHARIAHRKM
jgi:acetone carboxylase gamma subunit